MMDTKISNMDSINEGLTSSTMNSLYFKEKSKSTTYPRNHLLFTQEVQVDWTAILPSYRGPYLFNPSKVKPTMIRSDPFEVGSGLNKPTRWIIQLSDDYFHNKKIRTVAIYLWRQLNDSKEVQNPSFEQSNQTTEYSVSILDHNGNPAFTRHCGYRVFKKGDCYGWRDFIPFDKVVPLVKDKSLTLRLRLKVFHEALEIEMSPQIPDSTVDIMCNKQFVAKAKKYILAANSPVFRNKILAGGAELKEMEVGLSNIFNPYTIKEMITFLHEGNCPLLSLPSHQDEKKALYHIGMTYQLQDLKIKTYKSMCDFLEIETVIKVVTLSKVFGLKLPKSPYASSYNKLKEYFLDNMDEIKLTNEFKETFESLNEVYTDLVFQDPLEEIDTAAFAQGQHL